MFYALNFCLFTYIRKGLPKEGQRPKTTYDKSKNTFQGYRKFPDR